MIYSLFFFLLIYLSQLSGMQINSDEQNYQIINNLKACFGDLSNLKIIEIGNDQGELCNTIAMTTGFASYTIVNSSENNLKAKNFLSGRGIGNVIFLDRLDDIEGFDYDLCIGTRFFPECGPEQSEINRSTLCSIPNGYMHVDLTAGNKISSPILEELITRLIDSKRKGKVENVKRDEMKNRVILSWRSTIPHPATLRDISIPPIKPSNKYQKGNAVSYNFSGGRFGDNLVSYFHAKWISLKYGLNFIYKPFAYSDLLNMDVIDPPLGKNYSYKKKVDLKNEKHIESYLNHAKSTLLNIPYFPEVQLEWGKYSKWNILPFIVDWNDPVFKREVIKAMTPKKHVPTITLPENKITVGVHVRRGGDYESYQKVSPHYPLKFPPDAYYIEQLNRISKIFKEKQLYVYILTDDNNPEKIANIFRNGMESSSSIEFDYRKAGNHHDANVLTDFFSIGKFHCYVGSGSNFSLIASKLGNYSVFINPIHGYHENGTNIIDEVEIEFSGL